MSPQIVQKEITVVKGIVTVIHKDVILYQTNTKQSIQPKITFTLPKNESDIQYLDTEGTPQITPENIPSISITIKDKNGKNINSVANITTKE
jgi:hypothetical protein